MATGTLTIRAPMCRKAARTRRIGLKAYATKRLPQINVALKTAESDNYILRLKQIQQTLRRILTTK